MGQHESEKKMRKITLKKAAMSQKNRNISGISYIPEGSTANKSKKPEGKEFQLFLTSFDLIRKKI